MLHRTIRTHTVRPASKLPHVTAKDGTPLFDGTDQLHRWKYHFQEQFNNPALPLDSVLMAEAASATPYPSVDCTPPPADEISVAIRKLKKNRAPGICGITAELLKSGGAPLSAGYFLSSHSSGSIVSSPLRHHYPTLESKMLKIRLHQIPRHITSVCSGQSFHPHMSRTYEENDICATATATERFYPWPIHTESLHSDS